MSNDYSAAAENERDILDFLRVFYTMFYTAQENALFALEAERNDAEYAALFAVNNEERAEAQRTADNKSEGLDKQEASLLTLPAPDEINTDQLLTLWKGAAQMSAWKYRPADFSDAGNADAFAEWTENGLLHCNAISWLRWSGTHWEQ